MDLNKEVYKKEVKRRAPKSPVFKNCCFAFLIGGGICVLGQGMFDFWRAVTNYTVRLRDGDDDFPRRALNRARRV